MMLRPPRDCCTRLPEEPDGGGPLKVTSSALPGATSSVSSWSSGVSVEERIASRPAPQTHKHEQRFVFQIFRKQYAHRYTSLRAYGSLVRNVTQLIRPQNRSPPRFDPRFRVTWHGEVLGSISTRNHDEIEAVGPISWSGEWAKFLTDESYLRNTTHATHIKPLCADELLDSCSTNTHALIIKSHLLATPLRKGTLERFYE